jgi:hypothetical protein
MTCNCPRGWCYERTDCRRKTAAPPPDAIGYIKPIEPSLRDLRLAQLTARRTAIIEDISHADERSRRSMESAVHALDRAIAALH